MKAVQSFSGSGISMIINYYIIQSCTFKIESINEQLLYTFTAQNALSTLLLVQPGMLGRAENDA